MPGSAAAQAGIETGDVIRRFDTVDNPDWMQVGKRASMNLNQTVPVTVDRDGKPFSLSLHVPPERQGPGLRLQRRRHPAPDPCPVPSASRRCSPARPPTRPACTPVTRFESVDGHPFHYRRHAAGLHAGRAGQAAYAGGSAQRRPLTPGRPPRPSSIRLEAGLSGRQASRCACDPLPLGKAIGQVQGLLRR